MTKEVGVEAMGEKVTGDKAAVVEGLDMTKEVGVEAMGEKVTGVKMAVVEGVDMADVVVVVVVVKEVGGWVKEAFFEMTIFFWAARQISIKIDLILRGGISYSNCVDNKLRTFSRNSIRIIFFISLFGL